MVMISMEVMTVAQFSRRRGNRLHAEVLLGRLYVLPERRPDLSHEQRHREHLEALF